MLVDDLTEVMVIETAACPIPFTKTSYRKEIEHNHLSHYHVLTAETETILGYVGHWMMAGECHITTIAVDPDEQSNGYGELLLLFALRRSLHENATLATLEVRQSNTTAQNLYHKTGFEIVGQRKKFYKDTGENAHIMTVSPFTQPPLAVQWNKLLLRLTADHTVKESTNDKA